MILNFLRDKISGVFSDHWPKDFAGNYFGWNYYWCKCSKHGRLRVWRESYSGCMDFSKTESYPGKALDDFRHQGKMIEKLGGVEKYREYCDLEDLWRNS